MPQRPASHRPPCDFASEKRCEKSAVDGTARCARHRPLVLGGHSQITWRFGGVGHVLHFITWSGQCQCYVTDRRCTIFLRYMRFAHAPCVHHALASRARVLLIIVEGGWGAAVLRNLGRSDRCYLRYMGEGSKMVKK